MPLRATGEMWKLRAGCAGRRLVGERVVVLVVVVNGRRDRMVVVVAGLEVRVMEMEIPVMARGVRDSMLTGSVRFSSID